LIQNYNPNKNPAVRITKTFVKPTTELLAISFWNIYPFSPTFVAEQMVEGNEIVPFFFSPL
jgi:hypothetical protein